MAAIIGTRTLINLDRMPVLSNERPQVPSLFF